MGNIHSGKEITVINMQEGGDSFGNLKAIADELQQSFGGIKNAVNDANLAFTGFNETVSAVEGILKGEFLNDIAITGQEALALGNTLQNLNTQFGAFLQTYIQSGFLQQIEQLLLLTEIEIAQLDNSIDGKLIPAIALLTQDVISIAKSGSGGDSWLGILDHVISIVNNGLGIYSGGKNLLGKSGAGDGLEAKRLTNTEYINAGETEETYGTFGGYESASTATTATEAAEGTEVLSGGSLLADPLAWLMGGAALLGGGLYLGLSNPPYQGEKHPKDDLVQHGDALTMAQAPSFQVSPEKTEAAYRKRNLEEYQKWKDSTPYEEFIQAEQEENTAYPGIPMAKAWEEGIFPISGDADRKTYQQEKSEKKNQKELDAERVKVEKLIERGIISVQNAPRLNTYKDLLAFKDKWQSLSPIFPPHSVGSQFPAIGGAKQASNTYNIHVEFHETYTSQKEALRDIHDTIVKVLTDAVSDSRIGTDIH